MGNCAKLLVNITVVIVALCSTASAALLRYEPFDYSDVGGTIEGKTNPDGATWLTAYAGAAPNEMTVASGSLDVPNPFQAVVGNSAEIDGSGNGAGKSIRLPLGSGIGADAGGTMYYSLALRVDELTGSTATVGGFFLGLNNTATATTNNPGAVGARLQARIDPTDGTKYNLGIFRNVNAAAAATSWSGPLTVGDTLFVVGSYESVAGTTNDIARLWINPDPGTFADPAFSPLTTPPTVMDSSTGTGLDIGIFSIILRQSTAPHVTLDELRVGTTWADVTPVPEPAASILFGCGSVMLLAMRRRNG
jgi:hypothetical protein